MRSLNTTGREMCANCKMLLRGRSLLVLMEYFAWMQPGCPGIPVESACRNNLSPQTPMRTPVVNGRSLRTHWREVEGECLARTGPRRGSEYHLRPWSTALRN